jgi:hypothetical protein
VKKAELLNLLGHIKDDEEIKIVIDPSLESGDVEAGDIHDIKEIGYNPRIGHLIQTQEI